jgi:hypothetical protein
MKRLSVVLILLAGCTEQTSWHTAHDAQEKRIEALEQKLVESQPPARPEQVVTAVISAPHPGVDSPDFPMKVIDGKIHVKHADTGEWVTGPLDGNENVYVEAYHESNPNRRKRFVFVDGEWAETVYDVEETE